MACKTTTSSTLSWLLLFSLAFTLHVRHSASQNDRKVYIVYVGERQGDEDTTSSLHTSMLQEVIGSTAGPESLLYSYKRSFSGFAAKLTEQEAQQVAGMDGVVSVFPSENKKLQTTRSWDFLGFPQQVKRRRTIESDIIVGVMDSGIWPESDSFDDKGFGPPPSKWKGACQTSANFTCNKLELLFGKEDIRSPRDVAGHGTHTASTAAGNLVSEASLLGYGLGTARGGVPSARIAVYKVCWGMEVSCSFHDILAAFDDAIADGVDIISVSLGGTTAKIYFDDPIAIGSFHAMRNGILTSTAAGNEGPDPATVTNFSPWSLSVASSTIDRMFLTEVILGNKKIYQGFSINIFDLKNEMYPIIYGGDAPNTAAGFNGSFSGICTPNSLARNLVKGKIVLCDVPSKGSFVAGAVGSVMGGRRRHDSAINFPLPASVLDSKDAKNIRAYVRSTRNPTATILQSNERKDASSPYISITSSRGPNLISPTILKPDLAAPGVHILAAWPPIARISDFQSDKRVQYSYNMQTGTSMACPHATGAAAYVKSFHPTWSPAAIMSALITTAAPMSAEKNPDAEFAYGAGNINPIKAPYPGLIYDINPLDYIKFLCREGYTTELLQIITGDHINDRCSEESNGTVFDLNYPTFALPTSSSKFIRHVFYRTVTNVGSPMSSYKAVVTSPHDGLQIKVKPSVLAFKKLGQELSFELTIKGRIKKRIASASVIWSDGKFQVRSPIVVYVP
ncbi:cucumisin-like isoform X2 [Juglans regia]|uniref:Cucumisin-like isoform X2 n=1 Tax=Juglans regia TaxID=51240 RepID=A0A6P9DV85_JUGRE|nr:cucumisin-like isoform X2 [Juglans regia]